MGKRKRGKQPATGEQAQRARRLVEQAGGSRRKAKKAAAKVEGMNQRQAGKFIDRLTDRAEVDLDGSKTDIEF